MKSRYGLTCCCTKQYLKQILQVVNYHLATYVDHLKIIIEGFLFVTFLRIVWGHKDSLKKVCLELLLKNNLQLCRLKRYCLPQKKPYQTNIWPFVQPRKLFRHIRMVNFLYFSYSFEWINNYKKMKNYFLDITEVLK